MAESVGSELNDSGPERDGLLVELNGRRYLVDTEGISWNTISPTRPGSDQGAGASASTLTNEVVWSRWRNNWIHGEGQEYADRTEGEVESDQWRYFTGTDVDTSDENRIRLADRPLTVAYSEGSPFMAAFGARQIVSEGAGSIFQTPTTDGMWWYITTSDNPSGFITHSMASLTDDTRVRLHVDLSGTQEVVVTLTDSDGTDHVYTSTVGPTATFGWRRLGFVYFIDVGPTPTVRFFEQALEADRSDWTGVWTQLGADVTGTAWTPSAMDEMTLPTTAHTGEMAFGFDDITSVADFDKRTNPTRFFETNWSTSLGWRGEATEKDLSFSASGQTTDLVIGVASGTVEESMPRIRHFQPWLRGTTPTTGVEQQQIVRGLTMETGAGSAQTSQFPDSMFVWTPGDGTIRLAQMNGGFYDELASFVAGDVVYDMTTTSTLNVFTIESDRRKIGHMDVGSRLASGTAPSALTYDPEFYTTPTASDLISFIAGVGDRVVFGENGRLYELNSNGTTTLIVDRGDDFIWIGALAVGTGIVVWGSFGDYTELFTMVTSDLDGTFEPPTPSAKTGFGEQVTRMIDVAGVLVVGTNLGLRLAVINADQSITYGPVNDLVGGVYELTASGVKVYAVTDTSPTLWVFDLSRFVSDLTPAVASVSVTAQDEPNFPDLVGWSAEPIWSASVILHDDITDQADDGYETRLITVGQGRLMLHVAHGAPDINNDVKALTGTIDLGLFTFDIGEPVLLDSIRVDWEKDGIPWSQGGTVGTSSIEVLVTDVDGTTLVDSSGDESGSGVVEVDSTFSGAAKGLRVQLTLNGDDVNEHWPEITSVTLRAVPVPFMSEEIELPVILRESVESERGQDVNFDVFHEWLVLRQLVSTRQRVLLRIGDYSAWVRAESLGVTAGALGGGNGLDGFTRQDEFLKGNWMVTLITQLPTEVAVLGGSGGGQIWDDAEVYLLANSEEYGRNVVTGAGSWFDRSPNARHATAAADSPALEHREPDEIDILAGAGTSLVVPDVVPSSDYTVGLIVDDLVAGTSYTLFEAGTVGNRWVVAADWDAGEANWSIRVDHGAASASLDDADFDTASGAVVIVVRWNDTTDTVGAFIDGGVEVTAAFATAPTASAADTSVMFDAAVAWLAVWHASDDSTALGVQAHGLGLVP